MKKGNVRNIRQLGLCSECLIECPKAKTRHGCDGAIPKKIFLQSIQDKLDMVMEVRNLVDPPPSKKRAILNWLQIEEQWRRRRRAAKGL